jgi:chromosome segregation ATPase
MPCLLALAGLFAWLSTASADDASLKAGVEQLLASAEQSSGRLTASEKLYGQLRAAAPGDVRPMYAMALVAIEARQYRRALEVLDDLLEMNPRVLVAQRAKAWVQMVLKDYESALDQMDLLSREVATREDDPNTQREMARSLGRMIGFLETAKPQGLNEALVGRYAAQLQQRLTTAVREQFDSARSAQARAIGEKQLDVEQTQEEAVASEHERRAIRQDQLAAEAAQINESLVILQRQPAELQAELGRIVSSIDAKLAPLNTQFQQLQFAANDVAARVRSLQAQIATLQIQLESTENEFERARLIGLIRTLDAQAISLSAQYRTLDAQASQINVQRNALLAERNRAQAEYAARLKAIGREAAGLQKRQKLIGKEAADLNDPVTGNTGEVRSKTAHSTAFTTYEPFPIALEKRRVLETLDR